MTHPLTDWLASQMTFALDCHPQSETARRIRQEAPGVLLALLRHPAMREPSEQAQDAILFMPAWRAGLDALAREVESSR